MNNFYIRLIFSCFVGFFVVAGLSNVIYPKITSGYRDNVAEEVAADEIQRFFKTPKLKKSTPASLLEKLSDHHLSWYYFTDKKGNPLAFAQTFRPNFSEYKEYSRSLVWRGKPYYESVKAVNQDSNLHVGFYDATPLALANDFFTETVPLSVLCVMLISYIAIAALLYWLSVTMPVTNLLNYFKRKDSGVPSPSPIQTHTAVSEILSLRKLIERKERIIDEQQIKLDEREAKIKKLNRRYEEDISSVNKEKTALYIKEAENQFIEDLRHSLDEKTRIHELGDALLSALNLEFPQSIDLAMCFSVNKNNESLLVSYLGFTSNPIEVYRELAAPHPIPFPQEIETCTVFDVIDIADLCLREIAELTGSRQLVFLPMHFQGRNLAYLTILLRGQPQSTEHMRRVLNRAAQVAAKALYHIVIYEELVETARTDLLTGYPNKNYLTHLMPQLLTRPEDSSLGLRTFSLVLIEGHDIAAINEKYGRATGDLLIKELGKRIEAILQQRRAESISNWGDHLIRYGSAQFLVILRSIDAKKANIFAQRLRQILDGQAWPGGINKWSTAIGITNCPEDSFDAEQLIINMETALSYARGLQERERIVWIQQVPKAFRSTKLSPNLGGSLDIFDSAALLQSLSISRKSGVLTVRNPDGKQFWCFLESGKPTKARMGKFGGTQAILEFLVLFEAGDFDFSDLAGMDQNNLTAVQQLDKTFTVPNSLERILMDGALAKDHYLSAQELIKQTDLFVWPEQNGKNQNIIAAMQDLKDPPSEEEIKAMKEILHNANGKTSLKDIFIRLEHIPTHYLWRGAALLMQSELIHLKKLATSTPRTF